MGKLSASKVASGFGCAFVVLAALGIDYFLKTMYATGALILFLAVASTVEFSSIFARKGVRLPSVFLVVTVSAPLLLLLSSSAETEEFFFWLPFFISAVLIGAYALSLLNNPTPEGALTAAFTLTGFLHLGLGFIFFAAHLFIPPASSANPYVGWLALFIFVVKANDILGYILGSSFGRRGTLHPISPNKSIEGSLFGFFGGIGISLLVWYLFALPNFSIWKASLFGVIVGPLSQASDLAESLLKRYCGTKDSGSLIPASGGFFDFADCFLLPAPASYLFLRILV
ncbi:MAG: phosphatidate cytidylyltransferase [Planctomycetota bacterium]|nr:phosphatidate cytidylyltransferase [Planctomycetota bacterium]